MKRTGISLMVGFGLAVGIFTVGAQAEVKQYTAADVVWRVDATIDYTAGPKGANLFTSVSAGDDDKLYIASYSNILIIDAKTGKTAGTIVDSTGTIQQYSDVAPTSDGNVWIADRRSHVYLVDPDGNILKTVKFETSPGFQTESNPGEIELDNEGNLYVSYSGFGVHFQVFTPEGEYIRSIITGADTLAGVAYFTFSADNTLFFQGAGIGWITEDGDKAVAHVFAPELMLEQKFIQFRGIAVDADENVYFSADMGMDTGLIVYKVDKNGVLLATYGSGIKQANWGDEFGADEFGFGLTLVLDTDNSLIIADANSAYSQLIKINMQE